MPVKCEMSWAAATHQWQKRYNKKLHAVSCRQLGLDRDQWTKEGSCRAANAWWAVKKAELDGQAQSDGARQLLSAAGFRIWAGEDSTAVLLEAAREALGAGFDGAVADAADRADQILDGPQAPAPDRSLTAWADRWKEYLAAKAASGDIDHTRRAAYLTEVGKFLAWAATQGVARVDQLTAPLLTDLHTHLLTRVGEYRIARRKGEKAGLAPAYAHGIFATTKQFVTWLANDQDIIPLPKNIYGKGLRIKLDRKKVETFGREELRALLTAAQAQKPKFHLYLLLMLNCGMYPNDIAELHEGQVDFERGLVKRPRSKTPGGPASVYRLWPETLELLKRFRNADRTVLLDPGDKRTVRVLTTEKGKPLVAPGRTDNVRSQYRNLLKNNKGLGGKPLMLLRKTAASTLERHREFARYSGYFLAHSPRGVTDERYVKPHLKRFLRALRWLRGQILGE